MNKEVGKMRSIRMSKEAIGFLILTTLLSLAFVVSIVYALYSSEGGWAEEVSWSSAVSWINYNDIEKRTYSTHSVWVYNNRCEKNGYPSPKILVHYDFEHLIQGLAPQGYIVQDSGWINVDDSGGVPSKEEGYHSNTLSLDVSGLNPGQYTLCAYTRLEIFDSGGDKINLQTYPDDPDIDGFADRVLEFTR